MFPKFSVVVSRFRCQSPDGRHFAFNMGFFDNTEHGTCAELGEFSTHNPTHKMLDAVEVRSSSLLVPTIFLHHLASLTSLRKAPNGSIKRADPEGIMFHTSSNPDFRGVLGCPLLRNGRFTSISPSRGDLDEL